ncbi:hypothetical protein ACJX0J_031742, partial [Zea mays]
DRGAIRGETAMTAEGTACNGAGEAPKAEFVPEKVVTASLEEKAAGEREGEDVGGPFVVVNGGDSDGHSDRGSDLGKASGEESSSEEEDVPGSNVAPDLAVGGDHGSARGEVSAQGAALGASSADGSGRASDGAEGGADEGKGEPSSDFDAEAAPQEDVGEEDGGAAALASSGCEPAITGADSEAAPAVDDEVEGKEGTVDGSAVADVAEAVVHQEVSTEHDDALTLPKSSASMESEVIREDNKEQSTADIVGPHEQGTCGASALVENEHLCADMRADSFVAVTEPDSQEDYAVESCMRDDVLICTESGSADIESEVNGKDSKQEQSNADVVEVIGQGVVRADALMANGHLCADIQADSSEAATKPDNIANESKLTEVAESGEDAAASGELDAIDASSQTNGHIYVASGADSFIIASESKSHSFETDGQETDQQEEEVPQTEAELLDGVLKPTERNCARSVEELIGEEVDTDGHPSVDGTADASGEQEAKPMQVEGEATCGILEFEEVDKDGEDSLCNDCMVGVVSSNEETELPMKERTDEAVPSVNVGESEQVTEDTSQDIMQGGLARGVFIGTIFVKPVSDPHVESSLVHKVKAEVHLVDEITAADLKAENMVEVKRTDREVDEIEVKAPGTHEIGNSSEVEPKEEFEMEVDDAVSLHEAAASASENGSEEKSSNIAVDQVEPVNLNVDELAVDDDQPSFNPGYGSAKSSDVAETKNVEAQVTEQKGNAHHASGEWHGDHTQVIGPQRIYIIKVPKFAGDDLWDKIQAAQAHLDQLTQERDAINRRRQKQKAICDEYREKFEAARQEEREARAAHGDKKNDLNSVRSVLEKLHQANSVEELDELIAKKERIMQHETISLKEEKLLIKEINELKSQRKQLSATMGSKAEINEAFDQKDHIHERHKVLKKDSDVLFSNLKVLEENTRKIQKSFADERTALRKLTEEHRAANEIRQKAYSDWTELRSEPSKKNEYFFKYRDARNAAENFRANGDINGLISHCNSQIERVMEIWNKNEDFRKQYVESNKVSTLKRLGTHDGRKLGPGEDPPVIPSRRPSNICPLSASSPEMITLASTPAPVLAAAAAVPSKENSFPALAAPQTSKRAKSKASGSSAQIKNKSVIVSEEEDLEQTLKEKAHQLELARKAEELDRKAEELARKEEELRKERDAAEKERLRMEQKAKAKEAEERKRRKAEKDKERAEFKARKEAEEREK